MSKILFITATRIGDAVLSTGILARILSENPGARVTIACGPAAAPLFEAIPGLDRIIVLDKKPFSMHWVDLWWQCVGNLWEIVVDLRNAPLTLLIPARRHHRMGRVGGGHRLELLARVMDLKDDIPAPKIWATEGHRKKAAGIVPLGRPLLAIGATANWRGKTWPEDRFIELVARLTASGGLLPGSPVAIFGHASERRSVERLIASIPEDRRIDLVGGVTLLEAYACLERADLFIGNDSGLMHLAAAAGAPTLGLFGPTEDEHYKPWGKNCRVVRGASPRESYPDQTFMFDHRNTETLMEGLSVDLAESAAIDLYRSAQKAEA